MTKNHTVTALVFPSKKFPKFPYVIVKSNKPEDPAISTGGRLFFNCNLTKGIITFEIKIKHLFFTEKTGDPKTFFI